MPEKIRILLMDDMQTQFYLIEGLLLQSMGHNFELDWVATPQASLELIEKQPYDVFLLDYDLGKYTALDFLRLFQEHQITTPVIVLTGHGSLEIDVSVMTAGAVDFLDKTQLNMQILERSIRYSVQQARFVDVLRQSEIRFRAMVEKGSDLILQLDGNGTIIYTSPSVERLLGYSEEALLKQPLIHYIHPDDLQNLASMLEYLIVVSDTSPTETYRIRTEAGTYIWFEFIGTNLLHVGGIEAIVINGRDITERQKRLVIEQEQRMIAEALLDTSIALNSTLDFDAVILRILDNIGAIIPHQSANVMLIDEQGMTQVQAMRGYDSYKTIPQKDKFIFDTARTASFAMMIESFAPLCINNIHQSEIWEIVDTNMLYQSYLGAPIIDQETVIGFINLESLETYQFTDSHVEYIQLFAFLASIAITNAKAYQQAHELAALEERQRLARELHDAVSQTLFSASVIADSLTKADFSDTVKIQTGLKKLTHLNRGALAEMRNLLIELRPQAIVNSPLSDLISSLCNGIRGRSSMAVEFEIIGQSNILPPNVQLQLYRLTQEILNNVQKHAQAKLVNVELRYQETQVEIIVADDGVGFDLNSLPPDHHGIAIMRERAEKIGALLQIDTSLNEGTYIHIIWHKTHQKDLT